jgi:hypothetical protein
MCSKHDSLLFKFRREQIESKKRLEKKKRDRKKKQGQEEAAVATAVVYAGRAGTSRNQTIALIPYVRNREADFFKAEYIKSEAR